ncbi:MAG TPA: fasciclin domain-containing protein [Mucilaginibacter sp.]|jgi:uncharacterized surface protein with fasciclin (FAS1) repeats
MKKTVLTVIAMLAIGVSSNNLFAQTTAATTASAGSADLVATLSANPDYDASAIAIRAANLGTTLKGAGPYTILAPSNTAFSNLPSGKLDSLMADPAKLTAVLKGEVLTGKYDKAALIKLLGSGTPTVTTLDGKLLTLSVTDKHLTFTDSQGNKAKVIAFDMLGTNGVAIGIDAVLTK